VSVSLFTPERGVAFLFSGLLTYFTGALSAILPLTSGVIVVVWNGNFCFDDGDGFYGLCVALRADEFLRGNGNYKSVYDYPLCG
jgi:hypothetical protein